VYLKIDCLLVLARVETPLEGSTVELSLTASILPLSKFTSVAVCAASSFKSRGDT